MAFTEYEYRNLTSKELSEYSSLVSRAEDAKAVCDDNAAKFYYEEISKLMDKAEERQQQSELRQLFKEVCDVMKLPASKRNEYYAKVKKERGSEAAKSLVSEVKKTDSFEYGNGKIGSYFRR